MSTHTPLQTERTAGKKRKESKVEFWGRLRGDLEAAAAMELGFEGQTGYELAKEAIKKSKSITRLVRSPCITSHPRGLFPAPVGGCQAWLE